MPGEGKSTTVRNFALTLHEWGLSVVVVDADLRRPTMDKLFELPESTGGLVSVLLGETPLEAALVDIAVEAQGHDVLARIAAAAGTGERAGTSGYRPHTGEGARLAVLPAGQTPPNPQVVLATRRMEQVLTELAETFDVVVIDSPPILAVSDAIPLAQEVDGTLLVSRVGLTSKDAARRLKDLLGRMPQARVFGVVVNDFNTELGADYGAYGYGYGYGSNP
jgi:Mrp family chromosome partitioning ATPase